MYRTRYTTYTHAKIASVKRGIFLRPTTLNPPLGFMILVEGKNLPHALANDCKTNPKRLRIHRHY
jgi:hypothetical protein